MKNKITIIISLLFIVELGVAQQLPLVSELKVSSELVRADTSWVSKSTSLLDKRNATRKLRDNLLKENTADTLVQETVSYTYKADGNMLVHSLSVTGYPARREFHTATPEEYEMLFPKPIVNNEGKVIQSVNNGKSIRYSGLMNFGGGLGLLFNEMGSDDVDFRGAWSFYTSQGVLIKEQIFLGTGIGLLISHGESRDPICVSLPLYANFRGYFTPIDTKKVSGYIDTKLGVNMLNSNKQRNKDAIYSAGGLFFQTGIGFVAKKFDMGFSYEYRKAESLGALMLTMGVHW